MAFVTPVVQHWLERDIAQWVHLMKDDHPEMPKKNNNNTKNSSQSWTTSYVLTEGVSGNN